ncbi:MAG: endonuclease V [Archaeoglobaceae archaeon]|nr:endonuclease V [Archaeoglobaceae archaeon]MCX8152794.1 endonuclease V [Archaeoglobaceae archaeon]MDW8013501.1 endonuclease V [Archaeoglobaceae archaeon]
MLEELKKIQIEIAKSVVLKDKYKEDEFEFVIGVDQAFFSKKVVSAAVKFSYPELEIVETNYVIEEVNFPYVPTFLMFREGEPAVKAVKPLLKGKCAVLVDGSGIAHPRRCGLATYIAVKTQEPSVGVTKKKLFGEEVVEEGLVTLKEKGEIIGYVVRGCKKCKPVYISPGSFITPKTSLVLVKNCFRGCSLPEPLRVAHELANKIKLSHV